LQPTIGDYIGVLENPCGVFRTLSGAGGTGDMSEVEVERDIYGAPRFVAGNSAAVFIYRNAAGEKRLLKCYIRPNTYLRDIYHYVERQRPALLPGVRLLRDEIYVHTHSGDAGWVDVVEGAWIEGETLAAAAARAVRNGDAERLTALAVAFDAMCDELAQAEWAHGDLKPENIVVPPTAAGTGTTTGTGTAARLRLIDCDAMWIPALEGRPAVELGTPPWSDPRRTPRDFDRRIDLRPAAAISKTLHALAQRPELRTQFVSLDMLFIQNISIFL
jgi:hypothetical protein